jgi:RNA polymerase sigma-70 factor (ECF subfamily)
VYSENIVSDTQVAEDIVQDVFTTVWIKRDKFTFDDSLKPYLYKAVHNASIHYLRHQQVINEHNAWVRAKLKEDEFIPSFWNYLMPDPAVETEIQDLYEKAMGALPQKTREIFLLSREQGLKNFEIALKINLSVKSIEYHISSALKIFRILFKDYLLKIVLILIQLSFI